MYQPEMHAPDRIARAVQRAASTPLGFLDYDRVVDHTYAIAAATRAGEIADYLVRCASSLQRRYPDSEVGLFAAAVGDRLHREAETTLRDYHLD